MPDAVLKIGALVDKDAITSGMEAGADGVKVSTTKISVYFQDLQSRASGAWKKISEDTRQGAASVSAESLKIAEATKAVTAAQRELSAAISLSRNPSIEAAASTAVLASAQANLRAKSLELKVAQDAVAEATAHVVPEMAASSAAIRSFEGAVPIRAIERFVGTTLGLGPLLTAAFPIIGAVDLGIMLFRTGSEMEALREKALKAGASIREAFGEMHDKVQVTNDDLRIQSDRLQEEIDKLGGKPGNGLQLGIDEAIKRCDALLVALRADRRELTELFKDNSVGIGASFLSGVASTGKQEKEILADNKLLIAATRSANEAYAAELQQSKTPEEQKAAGDRHAQAIRAAFHAQIETYKTEAQRLRDEQKESERISRAAAQGGAGSGFVAPTDNSAKLANIEGVIDSLKDKVATFDISEKLAGQQEQAGAGKQGKDAAAAANKAREERLRSLELEYGELQQSHKVTLKEEHDFWEARIGQFAKGTEQYKQLADKLGQIDQQGATKSAELIAKFKGGETKSDGRDSGESEGVARAIEAVNKLQEEQADDVLRTGERWTAYNASLAKAQEISASVSEAIAEGQLHIREQVGSITALGAAQAQARIHADEHARALKALREELEALEAVGANLKPGDKGYEQNATQQQGVRNQISQQQGSGQVQAAADQASISAATSKPYLDAFNSIDSGWLKVQRDLIQGNRNISRDFAQMGLNLVQTMAAHVEQIIANFARMEIRTIAMHAAGNAQKLSSDVAAGAAGTAIAKGNEVTQSLAAAKMAFKNTYASVSQWPVVGPILAPVLAAGAFAAVEAFEYGGIVGGSQGMAVPILAHAGERVLTPYQTQNFERMVSGGGSSGATINIGGNHSYTGHGSADFGKQLTDHRMKLVKVLKRLKREGHI